MRGQQTCSAQCSCMYKGHCHCSALLCKFLVMSLSVAHLDLEPYSGCSSFKTKKGNPGSYNHHVSKPGAVWQTHWTNGIRGQHTAQPATTTATTADLRPSRSTSYPPHPSPPSNPIRAIRCRMDTNTPTTGQLWIPNLSTYTTVSRPLDTFVLSPTLSGCVHPAGAPPTYTTEPNNNTPQPRIP